MQELQSHPYVDTHCHLSEVLAEVRRRQVAPSISKYTTDLDEEERKHYETLGWIQKEWGLPSLSKVWSSPWASLSPAQRSAAESLGYTQELWERNEWLMPKHKPWDTLAEYMRTALETLGETKDGWNAWCAGLLGNLDDDPDAWRSAQNETRKWDELTLEEQKAATALGLSKATFNTEEEADLVGVVTDLFGAGFEGVVTQGCDGDSLDSAVRLAQSHPKVYAALGCHPKAAWWYNTELENRFLAAIKACGKKAVAWGEFGLDYSHEWWGVQTSNRRRQREVFERQITLALQLQLPMVVHSRAADHDTLVIMRKRIPRDWKVHIHSYRGSVEFMEILLRDWDQVFIGVPGIVTMDDPHAHELARKCPLNKILVETDGPYLPLLGHGLSHPGHIGLICETIAELKGIPLAQVAAQVRENARIMYGI